jgi:hypothetical protein
MVLCNTIFVAITSISVCFGSIQSDIDEEGQACAAMATALPQLQTIQGRNHYNFTIVMSQLYHPSSDSCKRTTSHENTHINQWEMARPFGLL